MIRKLDEREYNRIWRVFERSFDFRPGVDGPFPGIVEPNPSVTFELIEKHQDKDVDEFAEIVRRALQHCSKDGGEIYYLDWQHECFAFQPADDAPFSGLPDGDYAIFLAPDLTFGSFGHPWEGTLCFFGSDLIEQILR